MTELFFEWLLFAAKCLTVCAIAVIALLLVAGAGKALKKGGGDEDGELKVKSLRTGRDELRLGMRRALLESAPDLGKDERKKRKGALKGKKLEAELEEERRGARTRIEELQKQGEFCPKNLYVIDFDGDLKASATDSLRREIDAVLEYGTHDDEVVVRLTSPGGMVNSYGFAASQLMRLRERGIPLTVCVDKVAASGGYMMAAVADRIVAAPFAYIGSIGVVASIPNLHRVLKKYDVDYEQVTAGRYKRTLTMFGENTEEGRAKFREELEAVHRRFKEEVKRFRPRVDIESIATGEHWLAEDAKPLGLVDEIMTSDDYIRARLERTREAALEIRWKYEEKKSILNKILNFFTAKSWMKALGDELEERILKDGTNGLK